MPTADCKGEPGKVAPVIDRNRCEAKADCVRVCPYDVFEIRPLAAEDRAALSLFGRVKAFVHGNKQVEACPENAIRLAAYHA